MTSEWVVVAGASRGIGLAAAKRLISDGKNVVAAARDIEKLNGEFAEFGDAAKCFRFDFSELDKIEEFAREVVSEVGEISGLFHACGVQKTLPLSLSKPDVASEIFRLNSFSAFELVRVFSKKGRYKEWASFVLTSSLAAHEGALGKAMYAASKGAVEGFLRAAAAELAQRKIRLNAIVPGVVKTDMSMEFLSKMSEQQLQNLEQTYPLGLGNPDDVASMVSWLLSKESCWATGQSYTLDGGHTARAS